MVVQGIRVLVLLCVLGLAGGTCWGASSVASSSEVSPSRQSPAKRPSWLTQEAPYPLHFPAEGVVSSPFGLRRLPRAKRGSRLHHGIDIMAEAGSPVWAAADGEVVKAEQHSGYGNLVEIRHAGKLLTRYGHLQDIHVTVGQGVRAGERIGSVGETGYTTGPNVHFETVFKESKVDPFTLFAEKPKVIPRIRAGESLLKMKGKGYK